MTEKMDEIQRFKKSAKREIDKFSALNFVLLGENKKLEEENKRLEKKVKGLKVFKNYFFCIADEVIKGTSYDDMCDVITADVCKSKNIEEFSEKVRLFRKYTNGWPLVDYLLTKCDVHNIIENYEKLKIEDGDYYVRDRLDKEYVDKSDRKTVAILKKYIEDKKVDTKTVGYGWMRDEVRYPKY